MLTITLDDAVKHLTAAVAERGGDYFYTPHAGECVYVWAGEPDCGVGVCFARAGVDLVANFESKPQNTQRIDVIRTNELSEPFEIEGDALYFLREFQRCQDMSISWGCALESAKNTVGVE